MAGNTFIYFDTLLIFWIELLMWQTRIICCYSDNSTVVSTVVMTSTKSKESTTDNSTVVSTVMMTSTIPTKSKESTTGRSTDNTTIQITTQAGVPNEGLVSEKVIIIVICVAGVALLLGLCSIVCHITMLIRSQKTKANPEISAVTEPVDMANDTERNIQNRSQKTKANPEISAVTEPVDMANDTERNIQNSMVINETDMESGGENDDLTSKRGSYRDSNETQQNGYIQMQFHESTEDISIKGYAMTTPSKEDSGIPKNRYSGQDSNKPESEYMEMGSVRKQRDELVTLST